MYVYFQVYVVPQVLGPDDIDPITANEGNLEPVAIVQSQPDPVEENEFDLPDIAMPNTQPVVSVLRPTLLL